jgi:serine/threonine protein kinase/Tfp pilus assembly protein PilF
MSLTAPHNPMLHGAANPIAPFRGATLESLAIFVADEMATRLRQGQPIRVEEYLARYAQLGTRTEIAVRLVYEELCVRRELGEEAPSEEYYRRFPQWDQPLRKVLECHNILEPDLARPRYPVAGQVVGGFQLVAELGRGLQGRVFLATQPALADRPLVLKLTPRTGHEHLSLARLQHTHIVPLYFVEEDATRRLLILGMPCFGGATFAQILGELDGRLPDTDFGRRLLEILDRLQVGLPIAPSGQGRAREFLAQTGAMQAVCWIGACLADALQYAHERGLVHLDVKPSNVLLTADGIPMLLDFHLARAPIDLNGVAPEWLGGTPAYMSPEQSVVLAALHAGRPIPCPLDRRSDIYSLGLLLYELLVGSLPATLEASPARSCNATVPRGLSDILEKCLELEPSARYASAAELAADLRRQMADLSLRGVRNRSLIERWRKWRRRRPHGTTVLGLCAVALAAISISAILLFRHFNERRDEVRQALEVGQRQMQNRQYDEALTTLRRGQVLAGSLPGTGSMPQELGDHIRSAEQARTAEELHQVAEHVRLLFGADRPSSAHLRSLERQCWDLWKRREEVVARLSGDASLDVKQRIEIDLLDLAILWTELHVHLAAEPEMLRANQDALMVLDQAEALFSPSPVLLLKRKTYAEALGLNDVARRAEQQLAETQPNTARDHYSLGWSYLRTGDFERALPQFDRSIEIQPHAFWPHYYKGICAYRLKRFSDSVQSFSVCVALVPESAEAYFNRALAWTALERRDHALADYDRALGLNPKLGQAALNRGLLHFLNKRPDQAIRDLELALRSGADAATVHYNLALVYLSKDDRTSALNYLREALQESPHHRDARQLQDKLLRP